MRALEHEVDTLKNTCQRPDAEADLSASLLSVGSVRAKPAIAALLDDADEEESLEDPAAAASGVCAHCLNEGNCKDGAAIGDLPEDCDHCDEEINAFCAAGAAGSLLEHNRTEKYTKWFNPMCTLCESCGESWEMTAGAIAKPTQGFWMGHNCNWRQYGRKTSNGDGLLYMCCIQFARRRRHR